MSVSPSAVASTTSTVVTFAERQQEKFPLNTFFSLQTFRVYHAAIDLVGRVVEYPLSVLQLPFGGVLPCSSSEIQTAINTSRYRSINTDII